MKIQFTIKTILVITLFSIILVCVLCLSSFGYILKELPYRISKYHTYGEISIIVDGQTKIINDIPIVMSNGSTNIDDSIIMENKFLFSNGEYGKNKYIFSLPISILRDATSEQVINIEIEHFNTNWWHVNDLFIELCIDTNLNTNISGYISTRDGEAPAVFDFDIQEKVISEEDNTFRVRTESP